MIPAASIAHRFKIDPLLRYFYAAPGAGGMSPPQRDFHKSNARKRAFIAANKLGKSYASAAESWAHLLSAHPFRTVPPPGSEGWLLAPDLSTGWKTASKALHALEPPGVLDPSCYFVPGVGYTYRGRKILKIADEMGGAFLVGKGCEQSLLALEGERIQWAWVDEPPKQAHWQGLRARLTMDLGSIWVSATPVGRPCGWLRNLIEGNKDEGTEAEPGWSVQHIPLTLDNAPHRTQEDIDAQIAECSPWEYNQRILSQWDGLTADRWITGFTEGNIFDDEEAPEKVEAIGLGWDHGERPGKSIAHLVAWDGSALWVLGEVCNTDQSTPKQEAAEVLALLKVWGIDPYGINEARGDSNSAGRLGLGFSMNQIYERAFADLVGTSKPPFAIRVPYKGRGSVRARIRMLSNASVDGRFRVHKSCTRLIHSLRHWRGSASSDLKDPIDSVGYISDHWLAPGGASGPGRLIIS